MEAHGRGPLIFIGLPAATKGASGAHFYRPPAELKKVFKVRKRYFTAIVIMQTVNNL